MPGNLYTVSGGTAGCRGWVWSTGVRRPRRCEGRPTKRLGTRTTPTQFPLPDVTEAAGGRGSCGRLHRHRTTLNGPTPAGPQGLEDKYPLPRGPGR